MASPLQMSECRIQIPGAKKYRFEGPRRKPDNIGQIPIKNLLSPVLRETNECPPARYALDSGGALRAPFQQFRPDLGPLRAQ